MNFSSSGYPLHRDPSSKNIKSSREKHTQQTPRVQIPNYTTSSYNPSQNQKTNPPRDKTNNYKDWSEYNTPTPEYTNNMCAQYNSPVGVPLMPLYGYDNLEDSQKDWEYFRQMYPNTALIILREINEECDKLEYDGSFMFDECPDKVYLGRIIDQIYKKMQDLIEEPIVYTEDINPLQDCEEEGEVEIKTSPVTSRRRRNPVRSNNWLRDLIEILFYQELLNRRIRYRSRRRWF